MTIPARRWPALRRIARARRLGAKALGLVLRLTTLYFAALGIGAQFAGVSPEVQRLALVLTGLGAVVAMLSAAVAARS